MMRIILLALVFLHCGFSACAADLLDEIATADRRADAAISEIRSVDELEAMQSRWLAKWIEGLGGFPDITPLDAKEGPVVRCDGFTLQNVLFESQPGVFVVGHLALPDSAAFKPPYPAVLMPMGHSDSGILAPRYAAHLAMMARAGFAAFSWDPIGQGERRQCAAKYDSTFDGCACEHTRLGFRGWLVGQNFASFRIWDGIRALDWLETRGDVDCSRVGVCGTSGGGTMSAYLQAIDPRIKVAFPNCFVSSIRSVFAERGCHDAEQFFWNQLGVGVNHAAILALGCPRVSLAVGSRWSDYFPHSGTVGTFAVHSNLVTSLAFPTSGANNSAVAQPVAATALEPWHFHCAGPHGLPLPTRAAQRDWMVRCIKDGRKPRPLAAYHAMSPGDHSGANDPCSRVALPFPTNAAFFTVTRQVRDLKGFRSVYAILADRARELSAKRPRRTRAELREIVRRRAGIRPLSEINSAPEAFDHPKFGWWYIEGAYGCRRENEAAMLSVLGRSVVGRDAERIIFNAAKSPKPTRLRASGWDCIAAAHAYAAEPQLFDGVKFADLPPCWTEMVTNPDSKDDSFAVAVWGALKDYDWTDLVPAAGEARLCDGHLDLSCTVDP